MAIPANIHTLLSGSAIEWERIEFRESWQPEDSLKTITAFASDIGNRGGGYIVIGVADDNGRPKFPPK
ncbi:MAG: ATP-binding protein [Succinimonas sp.]|nr:ATP-binding protein [Succinimonas sp.]